mgnify:CR=1 FL=1
MQITGGCYCKTIRFKISGDIKSCFQCHCRECQYITGGNPNVSIVIDKQDFYLTKGRLSCYTRKGLKQAITRYFCSKCGTGISSKTPENSEILIVKLGALDKPDYFQPTVAIFTQEKQKFHHVPDKVHSFYKYPPNFTRTCFLYSNEMLNFANKVQSQKS